MHIYIYNKSNSPVPKRTARDYLPVDHSVPNTNNLYTNRCIATNFDYALVGSFQLL